VKVDEYTLRRVDRGVREFIDQATIIFNYGKYSAQVVGTDPQWTARNGEFVFFTSAGINRVYFYVNNLWNWIGGSPTGGSTAAAGSNTWVQYNSANLFQATSGFTYIESSDILTVQKSVYVNAQSDGSFGQNAAGYIVGKDGSSGSTVFCVRNSGNTSTIFEVLNSASPGGIYVGDRNDPFLDTEFWIISGDQSILHLSGDTGNDNPCFINFHSHDGKPQFWRRIVLNASLR